MRERLFQLLANIFDMQKNDIHEALTKNDIYKWDSLVQMELVAGLENEFNIQLRIDEIMNINSVKNIIEILLRYGIPIDGSA